jgi:4a-hydroxytetrahydrobiopterin dehydratase
MKNCSLQNKHCKPCEGGVLPLEKSSCDALLKNLAAGWVLSKNYGALNKIFKFKGFNKTMGFVNAIAWIANQENHHPDLKIGYDYCDVTYTTHAIDGLSENDFICASKIDQLLKD